MSAAALSSKIQSSLPCSATATRPLPALLPVGKRIVRTQVSLSDSLAQLKPSPSIIPYMLAGLNCLGCITGLTHGFCEQTDLSILWFSQFISAVLFLGYVASSLRAPQPGSLLAKTLESCRSNRAAWLYNCAFCFLGAHLVGLVWMAVKYSRHIASELVPLHIVGHISLALLALSEKGRLQKGRVKMEIEQGEGEAHPVMAQGARLAARNYLWVFFPGCLLLGIARDFMGFNPGAPLIQPALNAAVLVLYLAAGWAKFSAGE